MPRIKFVPNNKIAYDKVPVQVKVLPGVREQLRLVPDWQNRLRTAIDTLIEGNLQDLDC
jgi:hypothetical protein